MQELLTTLDGWRAAGLPAAAIARAVVVRTFGSAPRPAGAVLLVTADGRIAGSVSGGCVEGAVASELERARRTGRERVVRYGISDEEAWDVGLACGGTIDVLCSPVVPAEVEDAARAAAAGTGRGSVVALPLPPGGPGADPGPHEPGPGASPATPIVVAADGSCSVPPGVGVDAEALAAAALDALRSGEARTVDLGGRPWFLEVLPARPRVVVVGAVEAARTLARLARALGHAVVVVDGRAAFPTRERFPDPEVGLVTGWLDEVADAIGLAPADAVAVLSHDPKLDEPAIVTAFARGCRYVGAVGSRRTQADRRARLEAAGVARGDLDRLRGPIGLDLGGRLPAETALAILAEIVAERRGGSGRPLRELARERDGATG